jgi:CheY-like chemotaxis protein
VSNQGNERDSRTFELSQNGAQTSHPQPEKPSAEVQAEAAAIPAGNAEPPVVLIVDDDEPIGETIALILEEAGYHTFWVSNGEEALKAMRLQWPSVVLTDLMMPRMGGLEFIGAVRALAAAEARPAPRIALMTAAGMSPHRANQLGIDAIVLKPFIVYDIEQVVMRLEVI